MNPDYHIHELIDRYLNQELSEEELLDFKKILSADSSFASLVETQETANKVIIGSELLEIKTQMQQDLKDKKFESKGNSGKWLLTILILLGITSQVIFVKYFTSRHTDTPLSTTPPKIEIKKTDSKENTVLTDQTEKKELKLSEKIIPQKLGDNKDTDNIFILPPISKYEEPRILPSDIHSIERKEENNLSESNARKNNVLIEKTVKVDCKQVIINVAVAVKHSCDNSPTGNILIDAGKISGGTAPYHYALENENHFSSQLNYPNLAPGDYRLIIKDHNECKSEKLIHIVGKRCGDLNYSFAPSLEEKWEFPLKDNSNAQIRVINKSGTEIYSVKVSNGEPSEWNGIDNFGKMAETGYYVFLIEYENGEIDKGTVSILR